MTLPDVAAILSQLSLEEKVGLCSGRDFWHLKPLERFGLPAIMFADGPHGLRKQSAEYDGYQLAGTVPATCFPTASALASTWNVELVREVGEALGREARAERVSVLLGPGVNIKRSPLGGRNFEYFSEDPYLSGVLAAAYIRGVQSTGVGASLKHFAANNQETRRATIDARVDERALREIYLAAFEQPTRAAQPWTVMAAYNRLNGTYCSEHPELLTTILRDEWGFEGAVVSDWGAVNDRAASLAAGLDLEMPGLNGLSDAALLAAVRAGRVPVEMVDRAAGRVLALISRAASALAEPARCDVDQHHALARRAAAEGAVLLQNQNALLPVAPGPGLAVVGAFAKMPRYQGAGSSLVTPSRLDTPYAAMAERVGGPEHLLHAAGYDLRSDDVNPGLVEEAQRLARAARAVIVFAGLPGQGEVEGVDRQHLNLPASHTAAIEAVAAVNPNVAVVLMNGAPVAMPWRARVRAILEAYLGGQAGGSAVAALVFGEANLSGKLAETFPLRWEDHPAHDCFPGGPRTAEYRESVYVGYRYYDTAAQDVLFPFGHGLSYTHFDYSDLQLGADEVRAAADLVVPVSVSVTNAGQRAGQEVVQVYVRDLQASVFRPAQELRAFAKVPLAPGEAATLTFRLGQRDFAFWDVAGHAWRVEPGQFEIRAGASSREIRATARVEVLPAESAWQGPDAPIPAVAAPRSDPAEYFAIARNEPFSRAAFAAVCGQALPENKPERCGHFTLNTPIMDMRAAWAGRLLRAVLRRQTIAAFRADPNSPLARQAVRIVDELPLRMLASATRGRLSPGKLEALLLIVNGRFLAGLRALARARRNRAA